MPRVTLHKHGDTFSDEVAEDTNLVVRTGIRRFPYPHLTYGCGMGKCGKCACRVIAGAPSICRRPTGKRRSGWANGSSTGFRLVCQLWITHDIELAQDDALNAAAARTEP